MLPLCKRATRATNEEWHDHVCSAGYCSRCSFFITINYAFAIFYSTLQLKLTWADGVCTRLGVFLNGAGVMHDSGHSSKAGYWHRRSVINKPPRPFVFGTAVAAVNYNLSRLSRPHNVHFLHLLSAHIIPGFWHAADFCITDAMPSRRVRSTSLLPLRDVHHSWSGSVKTWCFSASHD